MRAGADARLVRAIAVMGATATGKSALAVELALELGGEIVSMDSRQVYRGLDIGTGKTPVADRRGVPHHLVDILDPGETTSAGAHAARAEALVRRIDEHGRVPLLVGGTGLYFRALFDGLVAVSIPREKLRSIRAAFEGRDTTALHAELAARDPVRARELSRNDRVRVTRALELIAFTGLEASELYRRQRAGGAARSDIRYLRLVLTLPRDVLRARVARRTRELFAAGWPREVGGLLAAGVRADDPAMQSLGYGEIAAAILAGEAPESRLERIIAATQQYAKRQETFFRGVCDAVWVDASGGDWGGEIRRRVATFLARTEPQ